MARLRLRLVRFAGVLAVLIVAVLAALHLPAVRRSVLARVQVYAQRELGVTLGAASLSYNLLARSIELRDVSLTAAAADTPFLQADRAVIVLSPATFLGRPAITRISLARPRLSLVRYADGTTNLPAAQNGGTQSSPIHLGVVSVTGLSARLEDRASARSASIGPFDLTVDTGGGPGQPGAFGPGPFAFESAEVATSGTIGGRLAFDGRRVTLEQLTAESKEGRIVLDGWADVIGERPAVSSHVRATIDLPQASRLARIDARGLLGEIDAVVDVAGELSAPTVALTITSRDASYAPLGPVRVTGRSSFSGSRFRIDALDIASNVGALHAQGAISLDDTTASSTQDSRIALRWTNLRIDGVAQAFGAHLPIGTGAVASGSATADFAARDRAAIWRSLRATATTTFRAEADALPRDTLHLSGRVDLQLVERTWSLRHSLRLAAADADLSGEVTGRLLDGSNELRSTLGGRTRLRVADIGALPPLLESAGVRLPPEAADGVSGTMLATIDPAGTTDNPSARIDLGTRELRARQLPSPAALQARLVASAAGLRADRLQATAGSTSLEASGRLSWSGPVDARIELNQGDLSEVAGRFALPVGVSGSARLEGTISGVPRAARAELSLAARDVVVDGVAIGPLAANGSLSLADGGLTKVQATAPEIGARAQFDIVNRPGYPVSGEISVDHQDVRMLIPPQYVERVGDLSGQLQATARGSGLLSDPAGIRGRADIAALDATWRGVRFALAGPASVVLDDDRIGVDSVDLRLGRAIRVTAGGQLGVAPVAEGLRVRLDGPLSELIAVGSRAAAAAPVAVRRDGAARLDLVIGGTLDHPQPNGTFTFTSPSLEYGTYPAVTALALEAAIDPAQITLRTVAARWQGATLGGEGALPWRVVLDSIFTPAQPAMPPSRLDRWRSALPESPSRARMTLRVGNITHDVLTTFVSPERLTDIQGSASATIALEADALSLEAVHAAAVLDPASVTLAGVAFAQSVPTRLSIEGGQARIEDFRWSAQGNTIVASGGVSFTTSPTWMDLALSGGLDLRALGAFLEDVRVGGRAQGEFRVTGPLDNPDMAGRIAVADGEVLLDSPRVAASDFAGTIHVERGRTVTVLLDGLVNTGNARIAGLLDVGDLAQPVGNLQLTGRGIALEYPAGLQTESDVDLDLALAAAGSTLSGRIDVRGGTYREPLVLTSQLLNFSSASGIATAAAPSEWLSRLRLNVAVATTSDLHVDNNYGRFDLDATLRLTGTAASPGVLGRIQAADDGEIYLGGNTYQIERLAIDLTNPRGITPDVTFAAQTKIAQLPIGIEFRCPAARPCERKVTSLAAGTDDKDAEALLFGTTGSTASTGEALARLLSGELLGVVGHTFGLDSLRLEQAAERRDIFDDPTLISGDVDPAARLTLAKRLGSDIELVYSQNLADDGFTWSTTYFGPYGLSGRLLILDDQSRSYEFRHEPPIGAGATRRRPRPPGPRIDSVTIIGAPGFSEDELRRQLRLGRGDRFTFGEWQRDRDRLERFYYARDFREARIRARRLPVDGVEGPGSATSTDSGDERIRLEYAITRGPKTELIVRGATLPDDVRDRILDRWAGALFDGFLERDAQAIVREHFYRQRYLKATVSAVVATDTSGDLKTLIVEAAPGAVVLPRIDIAGNHGLPTDQLRRVIDGAGMLAAWLDPRAVERLIENHYRSEGFLAADVTIGAPQDRDGASIVAIDVTEGPPYVVGAVTLKGLPGELEAEARRELGLANGARYRPASVAEGVGRVETLLRRAAYRQAAVDIDSRVDPDSARVDLSLQVTAGPRAILRDVVVDGGDATKPAVARSIALETGAPLDVSAIGETRRRLYDLDIYRSVEVEVQPLTDTPPGSAVTPLEQPVVARISLEERPRYRLRYGLAVSDQEVGPDQRDRRLGFAADLENRNILGLGATGGLSLRLRRDQQVGRLTVGAKRLFNLPIRSTLFLEREREQLDPEGAFPITSNITSLTAEQAYRIGGLVDLRYGYGVEKNRTFIRSADSDPFDLTVKLARFTTSGLIDRRDDPFNPVRGWFASSALELSTPGLGSDLRFLKNFAQYSQFVPIRGGLVAAAAARLGLARTFEDQLLIPSERFYAGGANSVRGYREDDLGARSILGGADGGSALLVLNAELRSPVYKWLGGVAFVDAGNVYPRVNDMSFTRLQVGAGAGARLDTPVGLIRFDVGVPVNRRPDDPRWRFHFGLGHAF